MDFSAKRIEAEHQKLGHTRGWRFLTCPERNLGAATVALVTINPGGSAFEPAKWSVEDGSAYEIERWKDCSPGQEPLQRQVVRMFEVMGVKPATVLSGYLVPFRSRSWKELPRKSESLAFGIEIWRQVLDHSDVQTVISFGKDTAKYMADILRARLHTKLRANWGEQTIDRYTFGAGGRLIVLPHLSRYTLFGRASSEPQFRALLDDDVSDQAECEPKRAATPISSQKIIRLLVAENPKRGKSRLRFGCYQDGMTTDEYQSRVLNRLGRLEAAKCVADLNWDTERSFIRIERQ